MRDYGAAGSGQAKDTEAIRKAIDAEKGFSCKDAKNIAFRDVQINTKKGPALICEDTAGLEIEGFRTLTPHAEDAVVDLKNVSDAYIHGCRATPGTQTFLQLRGANSRGILLQGNDFRHASLAFKAEDAVPASAVVQDK